ncbi:MAG: hypothetical protein V7700_18415, partial [Halioglobus sp.]
MITIVMALPFRALAEDIDLFLGWPAGSSPAPNILFIIDNTGNWTQPFTAEIAALEELFLNQIPGEDANGNATVNVGIMMFTETGGDDSGPDGGYMRAAIRPMTDANRALYAEMIAGNGTDPGFDEGLDKSNSGKAGVTMAEAYKYFAGVVPYAGNSKAKTDYRASGGNISGGTPNAYNTGDCCVTSKEVWKLPGNAMLFGKDSAVYHSPIAEGECGNNYIIWIGNGAAQDSADDSKKANELLYNAATDVGLGDSSVTKLTIDKNGNNPGAVEIPLSPVGSQEVVADEWAAFMKWDSGLDIKTYTIDINKVLTGQGPGWSALLRSMAEPNGGKYFDIDEDDLLLTFSDIFGEILVKNSVFASVALPASGSAQSTFLNQIYVGLFRPDGDALPRWPGNLKQYKLALLNNGELVVVDAYDQEILNNKGSIDNCVRSYWNRTNADKYWAFMDGLDPNDPNCDTVKAESNYPDGPEVEKGGQAYRLREIAPSARTVYTCDPNSFDSCSSGTGVDPLLSWNDVPHPALDANDPTTDHPLMVAWAAGEDTENENAADTVNTNGAGQVLGDPSIVEMRPSVHGDVIHTQPVALNYADPNDPRKIVVFYSGNDGMLRAVNGNRDDPDGGNAADHNGKSPGQEFWAFMPPEFYHQVKRLRVNNEVVRFPASGPDEPDAGAPKPYGIDGPITSLDDGTNKYIFAGMRRGGRIVYALDVTNPATPQFKWKKGCNATGCTDADWAKVGQTWSPMQVVYADGYPDALSAHDPLLIMGGGYDECEDHDT